MYKGFTSEGGIRAPLLVKLPGEMANSGTKNHSFLHIRDIMPTILDVADVSHREEMNGRQVIPMQGRSVLDVFNGKAATPYEGASQVGYELFGMKAYFNGDWKVLWMPEPIGKGDWELFNIKDDPAELRDLSAENPQKLEELVGQWERYKEENGVLASDESEMVE
jgi:arylsulfatase